MNIDMYRVFFKIQKKHWWFVTKKEIVLDVIDRYALDSTDMRILDVGCGAGLMLGALEEHGQVFGMDMSDDAIRFSKEIFQGEVKKGFLPDQIPYEEGFFNLITALDVIEHVDNDVEALKLLRSRLTENGKAIITVPAYMFLWSAFDELNEHKRRYTLTELKYKLQQAGFTVEKITYFNTILFPVVYVVRMLNNFLKRNGASDVEIPSAPINYILKIIFGFEKFIIRFASLPFGVSILAVVKK